MSPHWRPFVVLLCTVFQITGLRRGSILALLKQREPSGTCLIGLRREDVVQSFPPAVLISQAIHEARIPEISTGKTKPLKLAPTVSSFDSDLKGKQPFGVTSASEGVGRSLTDSPSHVPQATYLENSTV
ncbi:uncharacterized protein BDZ83DRAFT_733326 [Colletotrichum acutatum]|uniref:Uncharacterized protein n=1 Tax=Glomerella acutata TaxID=27357 RepID=A0AAD8UC94_GLOAC|nr:uncharacterized protein BDZ83DRAFT_733326 [Colletotrichum acutatum]KAK1719443.1 hypothetical protein BDZ83DRAFT_733326 [Colletotrichum acutatum]